jgi:hypothetical protein
MPRKILAWVIKKLHMKRIFFLLRSENEYCVQDKSQTGAGTFYLTLNRMILFITNSSKKDIMPWP